MTQTHPTVQLTPRVLVPRSVWLALLAALIVAAGALAVALWYEDNSTSTAPSPSAQALPAQVHFQGAGPGATAIPRSGPIHYVGPATQQPFNGGHEEGLAGATRPATAPFYGGHEEGTAGPARTSSPAGSTDAGARLDHRGLNYQAPSAPYYGGHEEGLAGPAR